MYNPNGYPSNAGGYPPQPSGYPPQPSGYPSQSQYGQPVGGIGFDNITGGGAPIPGGYGQPASGTPYPAGGSGAAPYPTGGGMPSYGNPSFSGAAYGVSAAMRFNSGGISQQNYPPQPGYGGGPPQSYGAATQPYSGATSQPYGSNSQQRNPYGNSQQLGYGSAGAVPHGGGQQSHQPPAKMMDNLHLGTQKSQTTGGTTPVEPKTQGTIHDAPSFDAQRDAEILRKAMKGLGTDEKAITNVLAARSNQQRQKIKLEFATMYGKDLIKELKSELSGNYEKTVLELLMPPDEHAAYHLYNAIEGLGTDENCVIEILCSRSNADIQAICKVYRRLYGRELEKDLINDTSGHFRRLLVSLVQGARLENEPLSQQKAAQDARALYDAGEARWGTDESRFNVILASRSFAQLRLIFSEYQKISKRSLEEAVKSEMSGDLKDGMVSVIRCAQNRPNFFARQLYKSMKGLGTDDKTLIRVMVSRCEVDMVQIKREFQVMYKKTLESFIKDDCSGDYKKILVLLCNGN